MLKNLLQQRNEVIHNSFNIFQQKVYEVKNSLEILGIQATALMIENSQVVASYMLEDKIYIKGLEPGETTIIVRDAQNETAELKVTVNYLGAISLEIIPCLKNMKTTFVYFKKIMYTFLVAVDLNEALFNYLIVEGLLNPECSIAEVYYESHNQRILKNSKEGRFILGSHSNGLPILSSQEYALANQVVTLKFSKINYLYKGMKKSLNDELTITFIITDQIKSSLS